MSTFTTIRLYFRQYEDTPWYEESASYREHVDKKYHDTGKIISSIKELDADKLVLTCTVIWDSKESREEYLNDPVVINEYPRRTAYFNENNIMMVLCP